MKKEEFVKNLKAVTSDIMVSDMKNVLEQMPLKHFPQLQSLSEWYKKLNSEDKTNVDLLIKEAAEQSVFGVLCVIDGVRAIEDSEKKGTFELYYVKNKVKKLINTPTEEDLHDLF